MTAILEVSYTTRGGIVKIYRKPHALAGTLAMLFACYLYLPSASAGILSGTEWKVTRGDTLYAIGRAVYPGDTRKQARLRRDIMKLNPSVFVNDANNMGVGDVLKLPPYVSTESVVPKSTPSKAGRAAPVGRPAPVPIPIPILVPPANNAPKSAPSEVDEPAPVPIPDKVTPRPAPQPVAPAPVVEPQPETPMVKRQPASSPSHAEDDVVVSLGFSYGGDKLVDVGGGPDISAGSGVQLRLGYEQMFQHGSGYRASLGLQYYTLLGQTGVSYRDAYLQLAYQYRAKPIVYGIGVVFDTGATFKSDTTTEYDAARGVVVYVEYVGRGQLEGWGLSVTSLGTEEKNSGTSVNASRAEVYYSWRFKGY
jgi:hypothetical protein